MLSNVTAECDNDPLVYQACGFNTPITDNDMLCGGFFCRDDDVQSINKYTKYNEKRSCNDSTDVLLVEKSVEQKCDGKCDISNTCSDESECNGFMYGLYCNRSNTNTYIPVHWICNENVGCGDGKDEEGCHSYNRSEIKNCLHYYAYKILGKNITVPIMNYTRCATFEMSEGVYPSIHIAQISWTKQTVQIKKGSEDSAT